MSEERRWRFRVLSEAREWFQGYVQRATPARRRALRAAFDQVRFRLVRHPYIGGACNARFDTLRILPEAYRHTFVDGMTVFYVVDEDTHALTIIHIQTSTMDVPTADMLRTRR